MADTPTKSTPATPERPRVSPAEFVRQVRAEGQKVVWPTRRETMLTTVMVIVLTTVVAIFFFFVDWILSVGVGLVIAS